MTEMSLEADITRLCKMYLNNLANLKISLPSENVEWRHYLKFVKQFSVSAAKSHLHYLGGGLNRSSQISASVRSSMHNSSSMNVMHDSMRASSTTTLQSSVSSAASSSVGYNGAKKLDDIVVEVSCTPLLKRIDQVPESQQDTARLW